MRARSILAALAAALCVTILNAAPAAAAPPDPPVSIEAENLLPAVAANAPVSSQADCCGVVWSNHAQLWLRGTGAGSYATVAFTAATAGRYDLSAVLTRAADYGKVRFSLDGVAVGQLFDGYATVVTKVAAVPLGSAALTAGTHQLTLTLVGKNPSASGFFAGLDRLLLTRRGAATAVTDTAYSTTAETPSAGSYTKVYDPSVGESQTWYYNDHTLVQDRTTGLWHVFAITHAEPAAPQDETTFGHATAPSPTGPWTKQAPALTAVPALGEDYIWAPFVVYDAGTYYMFYAGGNRADLTGYHMQLATSTDLFHWTRSPANPLFTDGWEARDPMVLKVGSQWVMYHTATATPSGGQHIVAYRTSTDLVHWSARQTAFTHPDAGTYGGPTESPFVVARNGWYYLFVCCDGDYRNTVVYRSADPFHFQYGDRVAVLHSHAAEVVSDGTNWWITHAGWGQGGLWLAPLTWTAGVVATGRTVTTPYLSAQIQTWPTTRIASLAIDPAGGSNYVPALDRTSRSTAPYLGVGGWGATDVTGSPARVDVAGDRIDLVGIPLGDEPVTVDWLLTFDAATVQTDLVWNVDGPTTAGVWEAAFNVDAVPVSVGDPGGIPRTGDVSGFPSWTLASAPGRSVVAAYRSGSSFATTNHWFDGFGGGAAWQPRWNGGGATWDTGRYAGGTWRIAASAAAGDTGFADALAADLNTVN